jgi:hypothetical protein
MNQTALLETLLLTGQRWQNTKNSL